MSAVESGKVRPRYCVNCAAMLRAGMRFCPDCGSPAEFGATPPDLAAVPMVSGASAVKAREVPTQTEQFEYANESLRDRDIALMRSDGWEVERVVPHDKAWRVYYRRVVPGHPRPATSTVIAREYASVILRDNDIANMARYGWTVQAMTIQAGQYRGGRGCLLALVFLPLALLAGKTPDRFHVVYVTQAPMGEALVPDPIGFGMAT